MIITTQQDMLKVYLATQAWKQAADLLDDGVPVEALNDPVMTTTPLLQLFARSRFSDAADKLAVRIIEQASPEMLQKVHPRLPSAFIGAVLSGRPRLVAQMIGKLGPEMVVNDHYHGNDALLIAVKLRQAEVTDLLIPFVQRCPRHDVLVEAVMVGDPYLLDSLEQAGLGTLCNIDPVTSEGNLLHTMVIRNAGIKTVGKQVTPAMLKETVRRVLAIDGLDLNQRNATGETALMQAMSLDGQLSYLPMVHALLEIQPDLVVQHRSCHGRTLLELVTPKEYGREAEDVQAQFAVFDAIACQEDPQVVKAWIQGKGSDWLKDEDLNKVLPQWSIQEDTRLLNDVVADQGLAHGKVEPIRPRL